MTTTSSASRLHRALPSAAGRAMPSHRPYVDGVAVHRSLRPLGFAESQLPRLLSALRLLAPQGAQLLRARRGNARLGLRQGALSGVQSTLRGRARERLLLRLAPGRRRVVLARLGRGQSMTVPLSALLPPTVAVHYAGLTVALSPVSR